MKPKIFGNIIFSLDKHKFFKQKLKFLFMKKYAKLNLNES